MDEPKIYGESSTIGYIVGLYLYFAVSVSTFAADDWTQLFNRNSGWTGADGVFAVSLDGCAIDGVENRPQQKTLFWFSDTILGEVDTITKKRRSPKMVNHSFAILTGNKPKQENIEFLYSGDGRTAGLPIRPATPEHWYWLGDGLVWKDTVYIFLLEITKAGNGAFGFRHVGVDLYVVPLKNGVPDFQRAKIVTDDSSDVAARHLSTLNLTESSSQAEYKNDDGEKTAGTITFGSAILENHPTAGLPFGDGYIYIYGTLDQEKKRSLVVARCLPEHLEHFGHWMYYCGTGHGNGEWTPHLIDVVGLVERVAPEMSVTPILSGPNRGQYWCTYTRNTIGSDIVTRLAATPVGPFGEEILVHTETVTKELGGKTFAYNAKCHPVISPTGKCLMSFNVNSMDNQMRVFTDATVYYPRFFLWEVIVQGACGTAAPSSVPLVTTPQSFPQR